MSLFGCRRMSETQCSQETDIIFSPLYMYLHLTGIFHFIIIEIFNYNFYPIQILEF
jgi:hypothetical protein